MSHVMQSDVFIASPLYAVWMMPGSRFHIPGSLGCGSEDQSASRRYLIGLVQHLTSRIVYLNSAVMVHFMLKVCRLGLQISGRTCKAALRSPLNTPVHAFPGTVITP